MEEKRVKLTKTQMVDGEISSSESICVAESLSSDGAIVRFHNDEEEIVITFGKDEALVRTLSPSGQAQIPLRLRQLTEGTFNEGTHNLTFQFYLKSIYHSGINVFLEYDIRHLGENVAENAVRTEAIGK